MQSQPLFSVLIANYNNGKYLMDAIESVRQQTYTNWEIILVDDGSTDNSHELYKELEQNKRIHIFLNDQNRGCGYTKRRCAELANGELCGFLDPDDVLLPKALEVMVEEFLRDKNLSLVYSKLYIVDRNLNIIKEGTWQHKIPLDKSFLEYGRCAISNFATFSRSKYLETIGIRIDAKRAVDYSLYYLMEEVGDVLFVPQCLYLYRMDTGNNISVGKINSAKAKLWELLLMEDACLRRGLDIEDVVFPRLYEYIDIITYDAKNLGILETKNTIYYKLGYALLFPIRWLKNKKKSHGSC